MNHRCLIRERANDDADAIAAYIARDNMDAALGFYDAFLQARERLTLFPGLGPVYGFDDPDWADVRFWPITRYSNYLIFYGLSTAVLKSFVFFMALEIYPVCRCSAPNLRRN